MRLSKEQTKALLNYIASSKSDDIDCDGCFKHMAEFVEHELLGRELPEAFHKVKRHIEQCACCNDEHDALLEGLRAVER